MPLPFRSDLHAAAESFTAVFLDFFRFGFRSRMQIQLGMLAVERGHYSASEKAFKMALSQTEKNDIIMQVPMYAFDVRVH